MWGYTHQDGFLATICQRAAVKDAHKSFKCQKNVKKTLQILHVPWNTADERMVRGALVKNNPFASIITLGAREVLYRR